MAQRGGIQVSGRFELMVWGYDSAPDGVGFYLARHEILFSRRDAIARAESLYERGSLGVAVRHNGEVIYGEGLTDVVAVPPLLSTLSSSCSTECELVFCFAQNPVLRYVEAI